MSNDTRTCIHCKTDQPIENFYQKKATGRRGSVCDSCRRERAKSWRKNGPSSYGRYRRYDRGDGQRECRVCHEVFPVESFPVRDSRRGTHRNECTPCMQSIARKRYAENPAKHRDVMRRAIFGLEPGKYDEMVAAQGGVCAICCQPETSTNRFNGGIRGLFVDHDHATGAVRQLLCQKCNFGLGQFRDNPELMERAASYIRRHRQAS